MEDFATKPPGVESDPAPEAGRGRSRPMRLAVAAMLVIFLLAVVATTVLSLGGYCLTTDGFDLRSGPAPARGAKASAAGPAAANGPEGGAAVR